MDSGHERKPDLFWMEKWIRDIRVLSVDLLSKSVSYHSSIYRRMPRQRLKTWRFNLTRKMPAFSAQDDHDVRMVFSSILDDADTRLAIHDLKQSSFSYDVPGERDLAENSGYLHASLQITKAWIFDGRIVGEMIEFIFSSILPLFSK